jgi:hypothetical protein
MSPTPVIQNFRLLALMLSITSVSFVHAAPHSVESGYALKYDIQDEHHLHLESGEVLLSSGYPTTATKTYRSINYVRDCQPSGSPALDAPQACQVAEDNVGNSLSFALSAEDQDAVGVITRIERGTFDGLANIEHRGYSTQLPITNGWYQTVRSRLVPGVAQTINLRDGMTMTLTAVPQSSN